MLRLSSRLLCQQLSNQVKKSTQQLIVFQDVSSPCLVKFQSTIQEVVPEPPTISSYIATHQISVSDKSAPSPVLNFRDAALNDNLIDKLGKDFNAPTPIQAVSLPIAMSGRNLVGVAQTGSGKTLAYLLPIFQHVMREKEKLRKIGEGRQPGDGPLALILAPTRELAQQIKEVAGEFRRLTRMSLVCCVGGEQRTRQLNMYDRGVDLIIATPGRMNDFLETQEMSVSQVSFVVLDEADRMLDMGFEPQVRAVLEEVATERQVLMFSATWPEEVQNIAEDFLGKFTFMNIGSTELAANPNITQEVIVSPRDYKMENFLTDMAGRLADKKVLVFTERKATVDRLERQLRNNRVRAMGIHGDKTQRQRSETINRFKEGSCNVMVATDVAARGLDISGVQYVVNFDFPLDIENYIHRIGRTGRADNKGHSITYVTPDEGHVAHKLIRIMRKAGQEVPEDLIELAEFSKNNKYDKFTRGRLASRRVEVKTRDKRKTRFGFKGLGEEDYEDTRPYKNVRKGPTQGQRRLEKSRNTDNYGFDI